MAKSLLLLLHLSVLLMSFFFFFTLNNAAQEEEELKLPVLPPAESPKPHGAGHHHHHHHPLHHHHLHPVYPPAKPPVFHIHPPAKSPVHPPAKSPVHPIHRPAKSPVHPIHPPAKSPVHPVHPPAKTPVGHLHPPVKPPVHLHPHPPVKGPIHPPSPPFVRNYIAVQGVVFCKSCKYPGIDTLWGATALSGSKVKLECNNTKYRPVIETGITDKNGYFLISPKGVTTAAFHKCKVFLLSSPSSTCSVPTDLHFGITGATLKPATDKPPVATPDHHLVQLFSVGPFAFEPSKKFPCPK